MKTKGLVLVAIIGIVSFGCTTYSQKSFDDGAGSGSTQPQAPQAVSQGGTTAPNPSSETTPKKDAPVTSPAPSSTESGAAPTTATASADSGKSAGTDTGDKVIVFDRVIYIERPIYYPSDKYTPPTGPDAVKAATQASVMLPQEYNGRIVPYDYDETFTYEIYGQPLRITDIYLEPGETITDQPIIGDSTRWLVGYGKSASPDGDIQHIYLKPTMVGLETTMTINTSKRIYYLFLKSFADCYMAGVKWRYPGNELPQTIIPSVMTKDTKGTVTVGDTRLGIDPALISTDYEMKYPDGTKTPSWLPTMVLDDGQKTYIFLPTNVQYTELPAVYVDKEELVNYRLQEGNVLVIDRLIKTIYLKVNKTIVTITKKGA